jgi:hypothetical protein
MSVGKDLEIGRRRVRERFPRRKLDPISELLIKNDIPLTLRNWLEMNYRGDVRLSDLDAEAIAEIPAFLLRNEYRLR